MLKIGLIALVLALAAPAAMAVETVDAKEAARLTREAKEREEALRKAFRENRELPAEYANDQIRYEAMKENWHNLPLDRSIETSEHLKLTEHKGYEVVARKFGENKDNVKFFHEVMSKLPVNENTTHFCRVLLKMGTKVDLRTAVDEAELKEILNPKDGYSDEAMEVFTGRWDYGFKEMVGASAAGESIDFKTAMKKGGPKYIQKLEGVSQEEAREQSEETDGCLAVKGAAVGG